MASLRSSKDYLKLVDYDCVGFDLDNTLCEYDLKPLITMECDSLINYMCEKRGYPEDILKQPLLDSDMDFLQRGLMLDLKRGNILKVSSNGSIAQACHGSKEMTEEEIISVYGREKQWEVTNSFCHDMISTWNGPLAKELRPLLDFFDISASLVFARAVDYIDEENGHVSESYKAGDDILSALFHQYKRDHFVTEESKFFREMKSNQSKYTLKCDPSLVGWLKQIKKSKITFLLTGSNVDFASFTAEYCLGADWKDLFDIVVCYARKPGFFVNNSPFLVINGFKESLEVKPDNLERGNVYSQGNWKDLTTFFSKVTGKVSPRCLYFGDNLVQDIYTPHRFCECDTVAVIEELNSEQPSSNLKNWLNSDKWGSYFKNKNNDYTIWGSTIRQYSKICIPSMKYMAAIPLDSKLQTFCTSSNEELAGFHPAVPASLKAN